MKSGSLFDNKLGCLVAFALPFAGVGVGAAVWMFVTLFHCWAARSWTETPATILEARLELRAGEDHNTYRSAAKYAYTFGGRSYESTKVSFYGGSDNIGSFHQDIINELSPYVQSPAVGETRTERLPQYSRQFRCYVNPRKPDEAVLYRNVRIPMILFQAVFVCVFGGIGFGMIGAVIAGSRRNRIERRLSQQYPSEPWKWQPEWAGGVIRAERGQAIFLGVFATFWNAISVPLFVLTLPEIVSRKTFLPQGLVFIFPLTGSALMVAAVRHVLILRRFGKATFQMESVPALLGGRLAGVIRLPKRLSPVGAFHLKLRCMRWVDSSGEMDARMVVLWEASQETRATAALLAETAIPVLLEVPPDQPESDAQGAIKWMLLVSARNPGVDLSIQFCVPVFQSRG